MAKDRVAVIGRNRQGALTATAIFDTVWLKCDKADIVAVADENEAGLPPPPRAAALQREERLRRL